MHWQKPIIYYRHNKLCDINGLVFARVVAKRDVWSFGVTECSTI